MPLRAVLLLLPAAILAACAEPRPGRPADVFAVVGAEAILRPRSDAERRRIEERADLLHRQYGYVPDGTHRDLRGLRDLLDRPNLLDRLSREPALSFGARLRGLGYGFRPTDARSLVKAAEGRPGEALVDPDVRKLLEAVRGSGLLHERAGRDFLGLSPRKLDALVELARLPGAAARVRAFAPGLDYRFRPSDAAALLREEERGLAPKDETFLAELLETLGVEPRPGYLPELREIASRPGETRELLDLAEHLEIPLSGPRSVLTLARLVRDHAPLTPLELDRLQTLRRRVLRADADDFLRFVQLARVPGIPEIVEELESRYRYRFRTSDSAELARLGRRGLPKPSLPSWIEEDRAPLVRPGLLLAGDPAEAFAGPNDLVFLAALRRSRSDLAIRPLDRLAEEVRRRLERRRVRYRLGAPYSESPRDLSGFLRPDLLKILLLIEALDRQETLRRIDRWLREDTADRGSERGGYVRLDDAGLLVLDRWGERAVSGLDDRLLLPPDPLGAALDFHFHATDEDETAYAGPSSGGPGTDLFRARRHRVDGLVITRLPEGEFDADFFSDRGFVLDLGIHRAR